MLATSGTITPANGTGYLDRTAQIS